MKKIYLIAFALLMVGCQSNSKNKTTESVIEDLKEKKQKMIEKASEEIVKLDCKNYFKKANYSSLCFADNKSLNFNITSSNELGCVFRFEKSDGFDEYLDVYLTVYKNEKDAKSMYNIVMMEMSDDLEKLDNLGDKAGIEKTGEMVSNKSLYIKHNNSFIQIQASRVVGTKATPCFYSNEEMIKFAKLFLSEL